MNPWTVDAHCHWSDSRVFAGSEARLRTLIESGIRGFLIGGTDLEEWVRQNTLRLQFPGRIWQSFGLHPYFVAAAGSSDLLEAAWARLEGEAPRAEAIGETGLDFRPPNHGAIRERQLDFFARHLRLAQSLDKPVVLHIVKAHEPAIDLLTGLKVRGMVHAFTGGTQVAERYLNLGLYISVGARLLFDNVRALEASVVQCPIDRLLIESDAPDQAPPGQATHDSSTVWKIAERIAVLKKLSFSEVVEQTRSNFLRLIRREAPP